MFELTRWNPWGDVLNFQREVDRLFNQFWADLPARTSLPGWNGAGFQVNATDDAWKIDVPMPGIDPRHVNIEAAGTTLTIRAEQPSEREGGQSYRYEQSLSVPQFLDIDKVSASHRHGMLVLTLPLKDSVKPRRIQIDGVSGDQKKLTAA